MIQTKERPILFSAPMVLAILERRKTQTRRVMKHQSGPDLMFQKCPYVNCGRLWVKETHWRWGKWLRNGMTKNGKQAWKFRAMAHDLGVQFAAPAPAPKRGKVGWHKRPSIFMPRRASRITLEIVSVRVERLQDISDADALAEGVQPKADANIAALVAGSPETAARMEYYALWESINGAGSWSKNPWVFAIEFKRL